jgi:hypothetical protein
MQNVSLVTKCYRCIGTPRGKLERWTAVGTAEAAVVGYWLSVIGYQSDG